MHRYRNSLGESVQACHIFCFEHTSNSGVITFCIKKVITFCVGKLLHFALITLLYFALMLLHFALVLHFAVIITFCDVTRKFYYQQSYITIPVLETKIILTAFAIPVTDSPNVLTRCNFQCFNYYYEKANHGPFQKTLMLFFIENLVGHLKRLIKKNLKKELW